MSKKHSKRYRIIQASLNEHNFTPEEALEFLIKNSKPTDSIDIVFSLDVDPRKSDQVVKGIVQPPFGLGKKITIAVLTENLANESALKLAGATFVGNEELAEKIKSREIVADVYLASKEIMLNKISKMGLASILKSKMPNLKAGTIVDDKELIKAIESQVKGQISFRSNVRLIQTSVGRASFKANELLENIKALKEAINLAKPQVIKVPSYIRKIYISSTMSPSIEIKL